MVPNEGAGSMDPPELEQPISFVLVLVVDWLCTWPSFVTRFIDAVREHLLLYTSTLVGLLNKGFIKAA
jgi:hypothetical protein